VGVLELKILLKEEDAINEQITQRLNTRTRSAT
jgi:hypothetical protein